ncbi:MAG: hypothetical protein KME29_11165 [Calothrix sp. FI2-JRJ7]|jgi:hypothetical protein|nr:hypothetical protein [Calothrix sp. FI2-JRJ7]
MTKVLEDVITQIVSDVENRTKREISEIDQFFQAERSKITAPQAEEFVTKYQQLYSVVKQTPLLGLKLRAYQEFNSYLSQIKAQYHEALQKPVIRGMDQIDSHIQALNHLIKAESLILTAFPSYHLNHLELDEYKKFHEGLEYLQKFVDIYGSYLSDSFLKNHLIEAIENIIASNIFDDSIIEYDSADKTAKQAVKNYIQLHEQVPQLFDNFEYHE